MQRIRMILVSGAALVAAAACSGPAPSAADDALRSDLEAAQQAAAAPADDRTQFVSALELGRTVTPRAGEVAAPRPVAAAPARAAVARRSRVASAERVVRPVARVRAAEPAPAPEAEDREVAPARVDTPRPEVDPAPAPARDEPVVAAPSRRPDVQPAPRRRGRTWDMGDVIRNAPFPINP
jgi:hypothetical protein